MLLKTPRALTPCVETLGVADHPHPMPTAWILRSTALLPPAAPSATLRFAGQLRPGMEKSARTAFKDILAARADFYADSLRTGEAAQAATYDRLQIPRAVPRESPHQLAPLAMRSLG